MKVETLRMEDANFLITSACVGCGAQLAYACDDGTDGTPHFEPVEHDACAHGHGHLCPPCASAVNEFLAKRRADRTANHAAVARGHK